MKSPVIATVLLASLWASSSAAEETVTPKIPVQELLQEGAERALRGRLAAAFERFTLERVGPQDEIECDRAHLVSSSVESGIAARMLATVRLGCGADGTKTVPVWYRVKGFGRVPVATRELPAGITLGTGDITVAEREVTVLRGAPFPVDESPAGMRLAVPLAAGAPLMRAAVRAEDDVIAQRPVSIRAKQGAVTIEVMGLALQNGRVGDRVQVLNLGSGDTLSARVVSLATVEVLP